MANSKSNGNRKLILRRSKIHGRGVYAARRIRKGNRIIEYTGELINDDEISRRYDESQMPIHHTFLFEVDEDITIDATRRGSMARYINHSCDPNCEAVNEEGRIFIEAIKNIQPGDELTYDYGYKHEGELTSDVKKFYHCICGAPNCRGTIIDPSTCQTDHKNIKK